MKENSVFLGAYDGEKCVGLAILQEAFFKYMYLYDLKVSGACRGQGVGRALMEKAGEVCKERGYRGLFSLLFLTGEPTAPTAPGRPGRTVPSRLPFIMRKIYLKCAFPMRTTTMKQ